MKVKIIVLILIISVTGYLIQWFAVRKMSLSEEKIKAFAKSKKWHYRLLQENNDESNSIYLTPPSKEWKIEIYSQISTSHVTNSTHKNEWVEWSTQQGELKNGMAILGPKLPEKTIKMLNKGKGGIFNDIIKRLMFQYTQGMDIDLAYCKLVEESMEDSIGAVLASEGNEKALDKFKTLKGLATTRENKKIMYQPIIIRDTKGIRIRIRGKLKQTEQFEQLENLGNQILLLLKQ